MLHSNTSSRASWMRLVSPSMRSLKSDFVAAVIRFGVPLVLGIVWALIFSVGLSKPFFAILLRHPTEPTSFRETRAKRQSRPLPTPKAKLARRAGSLYLSSFMTEPPSRSHRRFRGGRYCTLRPLPIHRRAATPDGFGFRIPCQLCGSILADLYLHRRIVTAFA